MSKVSAVLTGPFRLAFESLFVPEEYDDGSKKHAMTMLFPKTGEHLFKLPNEDHTKDPVMRIRKLINDAVVDKWGDDRDKWPPAFRNIDMKTYVSTGGRDGWPIRDGDCVSWQGFEGNVFIKARSNKRPGILSNKCVDVIDPDEVFSGLICRAQIVAYAYENKGNKGVSIWVNHVQIIKDDGTVYGSKGSAKDVFSPVVDTTGTTAFETDEDFA